MSSSCLFCDSALADRLEPDSIIKITQLFSGVRQHQLEGKQACSRCSLNLNLIENTIRLKDDMNTSLTARLAQRNRASNGMQQTEVRPVSLPQPPEPVNNHLVPPATHMMPPVAHMVPPVAHVVPPVTHLVPPAAHLPSLMNGAAVPQPEPEVRAPTIVRKRIHSCYKCNINLKTRTYKDGLRHIQKCTGQGIRKGRASVNPRPDMYPCVQCGRRLATREAYQIHTRKCDGTNNPNRGRKPADNTCMLCNEDLVYRHILKKHLRKKHGINAQRLDDSVLAALRTGVGPGIDAKEHVLSQIKRKLGAPGPDFADYNTSNGDNEFNITSNDMETEVKAELGLERSEDQPPLPQQSSIHSHATRSRKKGRPTKYVAEVYTCDLCNKQFEYKSQYEQHCCFLIQGSSSLVTDNNQLTNSLNMESTTTEN